MQAFKCVGVQTYNSIRVSKVQGMMLCTKQLSVCRISKSSNTLKHEQSLVLGEQNLKFKFW